MWLAVAIFAVTYLAMAGSPIPGLRIDRPAAALCGAVGMVVAGVLDVRQAFAAIDLGVITLLTGVMIIAAHLEQAHFFRYCAWRVLTGARTARALLWTLVLVSGALSALLLNDTICLMFTPLVVAVLAETGLPPLPYLLALASATNIGGVVTFTGNPQNAIIAEAAGGAPGYLEFFAMALPAGALCLLVNAALIGWMFRRELSAAPLPARDTPRPHLDKRLTAKALAVLALFAVMAGLGVSLPGAAIAAAALLVLLSGTPARATFARVDWSLLLLFAGLFVVVRGLAVSGAMQRALGAVWPIVGSGGPTSDAAFIGLSVLGSNAVSNVPYTMVAVEWIPELPDPRWGYIVLAFATTLAGNLTLFGSVANIIVFETAGPRGRIGFLQFLRYGAIVTAVTLAVAFAALALTRALIG